MYDLGGDPFAGTTGGAGFGAGFSFTDIMDAFFGQSAGQRGPRPRTRRGQDALIRIELELGEAAFGVTRELKVDTAVVCSLCGGAGTSPGTSLANCGTCGGRGEISHVQRSFLGEVRTMRPCPTCRGFGTVIPNPCTECSGDGRVRARRAIQVQVPAGVDAGNRIQLSGQGEVGPGGGPAGDLYVEVDVVPHEVFTRLPTLEADLTGSAASDVETTMTIDIKPGTQSGEHLVLRGRGVPRLRGTGRGDVVVTVVVQTPTRLDAAQEDLMRQLAEARGEENPVGTVEKPHKGFFGRMKDAFNS
jgi:molecular chaperone DnaJ